MSGDESDAGEAGATAGGMRREGVEDRAGARLRLVSASAKWRGRSAATAAATQRREGELGLATVRSGTVLPRTADDGAAHRYAGAVVDAGVGAHPWSLRVADGRVLEPAPADLAAASRPRRMPGRALYLGALFDAFGHFLVETTARLWALDTAEGRAADHVAFSFRGGDVPRFAREAFDALGLADRLVLVDRPTRFDAVVVPEAAFALGAGAHPAFKAACERLGTALAAGAEPGPIMSGAAVYLTRTRLDPWAATQAIVGERQIEAALAAAGVAVVAPETLSLAAQARLAATAGRLAGVDGSALHLALFAPQPLDLAVLCRRPLPRPFPAIDGVRLGSTAYLDALASPEDPRLAPNRLKARGFPRLVDAPRALAFLAEEGFGDAAVGADAALAEAAVREHNALAVAALCREAVRRSRPEAAAEVDVVRKRYEIADDPALDRLIEEMRAAIGSAATGRGAWKAVRLDARRAGFVDRLRGLWAGWRQR